MGKRRVAYSAWVLVLVLSCVARADVKLPAVFGDHMVLQRDVPLAVWGWADPGEKVSVALAAQSKTVAAGQDGRWKIQLDPLPAGGPHVLKVQGKNSLERADVLVGEVWLCSGQSNMAMTVANSRDQESEIAAARFPQIRMLQVEHKPAEQPQDDVKAEWKVCSPETVGPFSAAGYFFGRQLHQELGVPVGLLHSSWGGTPIQAWTSRSLQQSIPQLAPLAASYEKSVAQYTPEAAQQRYEKQLDAWKKAVAKVKGTGAKPPRKPQGPVDPRVAPNSPGTLYNGMIRPLAGYAMRGAIWYQGEANAGSVAAASLYGLQLKTMIGNWRNDWGQGDFAFLFVQLPNYLAPQKLPSETAGWPINREQMLKTLSTVPNTGMAITIDIGQADDIHPKNKQDVGKRLAQWALAKTYGKPLVAGGPLYKSMLRQDAAIKLEFDCAPAGLAARDGGKLKGFAIAGEDRKFVAADASIQGAAVVVSSPEVKSPLAVRYAWANNPDCNFTNQEGLPASPFRTDDWAE